MSNKQPHNLNQLHSEALGRDVAETKAARMRSAATIIEQSLQNEPFWTDASLRNQIRVADKAAIDQFGANPDNDTSQLLSNQSPAAVTTRDQEVLRYAASAHEAALRPILSIASGVDRADLNAKAAATAKTELQLGADLLIQAADQAEQQVAAQHRFAA